MKQFFSKKNEVTELTCVALGVNVRCVDLAIQHEVGLVEHIPHQAATGQYYV
jgi:hypothetical protein